MFDTDPARYQENEDTSHTRPRQECLGGIPGTQNGEPNSHPLNTGTLPPGRNYHPAPSMAGSPPDGPVRLVSGKNGGYHASPISYPHDLPPAPNAPPLPTIVAPLAPLQQRAVHRQPSSSRMATAGGGLQVTLGETGSWSDLAKQDTTLPADAKDLDGMPLKSNGMLGFLSRKKGRVHSPKPQERGVLGKEGARVVISEG